MKMSRLGASGGYPGDISDGRDTSGLRSEGREPGARRRKLAGYLKAANELRQSYQQGWSSSRNYQLEDIPDETPGAFPDAAVIRNGDEEMVLFPSYARKHIKTKPQPEPGTFQDGPDAGREYRDAAGSDSEFWRREWEKYEDDNAIVDVDVHGWIYTPHRGPLTRKNRLLIGIARQLAGIPASTPASDKGSPKESPPSSRGPSPHRPHRDRMEAKAARRDAELVSREAESILRKGEAEADVAGRGGYSEIPPKGENGRHSGLGGSDATPPGPAITGSESSRTGRVLSIVEDDAGPAASGANKRASWTQPADMSAAELSTANSHLMARLRPFLTQPLANTPISAFFYNDAVSRQRTINTDGSGHFKIRAALDFVPTHVRILASEKLSATEKVIVTEPRGVSLISDIDDTIKHSAISSGAREIFRNAFIRDLGDLTIEGVQEWYNHLARMGVKFHYVSNSPWQMYPVLTKFFALAGLPSGSFHLKQYSGYFQGFFEPVAERKKPTLDKIARDFPERSFILVGDSGEADLEVYTDFVLENPGRVLGVLIRDVTTPLPQGFFDSSMGAVSGEKAPTPEPQKHAPKGWGQSTSWAHQEDNDPDLKAAIEASIREWEEQHGKPIQQERRGVAIPNPNLKAPERRPQLPPRVSSGPPGPEGHPAARSTGCLVDASDHGLPEDAPPALPPRSYSDSGRDAPAKTGPATSTPGTKPMPPTVPKKPSVLRGVSGEQAASSASPPISPVEKRPPPLPKPRRQGAASINTPRPVTSTRASQAELPKPASPKPPTPHAQSSYATQARQKLVSAYNNLPSASSYFYGNQTPTLSDGACATSTPSNGPTPGRTPPPVPPARRTAPSQPTMAAQHASGRVSGASSASTPPGGEARPYGISPGDSRSTARLSSPSETSLNSTAGNGQMVNKKEEMWRRRWARAQHILSSKGVLLKSWRAGTDVMADAVRLVEQAKRREERGEGKIQARKGNAGHDSRPQQ